MASFFLNLPKTTKTAAKKKTTKSTSTKKTAKTVKPVSLSKFLSVIKKPELCGTTKYFSRDKRTGKYHAVCPIAKAAVKRGLKFNGGGSPAKVIAKKFNVPLKQISDFTSEWDNRIGSLKHDHVPGLGYHKTAKAVRNVKLTPHEMRMAFKQAIKHASTSTSTKTSTKASASTTVYTPVASTNLDY